MIGEVTKRKKKENKKENKKGVKHSNYLKNN